MIGEFLLDIVFKVVEWVLSPLPTITLDFSGVSTSTFFGVVRCVLYMLPLGTVTAIVALIIAISTFRIFIAIIKTIWDLLPLV